MFRTGDCIFQPAGSGGGFSAAAAPVLAPSLPAARQLPPPQQQPWQQWEPGKGQERQGKRQRWMRERLAAMGSPLALAVAACDDSGGSTQGGGVNGSGGGGIGGSAGDAVAALDLLTFTRGGAAAQRVAALVAADCSTVAGQLGAGLEGQGAGPLVTQQRLAWAWASPLTGSGWTRAAS
jgi:hypothetical protein